MWSLLYPSLLLQIKSNSLEDKIMKICTRILVQQYNTNSTKVKNALYNQWNLSPTISYYCYGRWQVKVTFCTIQRSTFSSYVKKLFLWRSWRILKDKKHWNNKREVIVQRNHHVRNIISRENAKSSCSYSC